MMKIVLLTLEYRVRLCRDAKVNVSSLQKIHFEQAQSPYHFYQGAHQPHSHEPRLILKTKICKKTYNRLAVWKTRRNYHGQGFFPLNDFFP